MKYLVKYLFVFFLSSLSANALASFFGPDGMFGDRMWSITLPGNANLMDVGTGDDDTIILRSSLKAEAVLSFIDLSNGTMTRQERLEVDFFDRFLSNSATYTKSKTLWRFRYSRDTFDESITSDKPKPEIGSGYFQTTSNSAQYFEDLIAINQVDFISIRRPYKNIYTAYKYITIEGINRIHSFEIIDDQYLLIAYSTSLFDTNKISAMERCIRNGGGGCDESSGFVRTNDFVSLFELGAEREAEIGKEIWTQRVDYFKRLERYDDTLVLFSSTNEIKAVDLHSLKQRWEKDASHYDSARIGEQLFIIEESSDDQFSISSIDIQTGSLMWSTFSTKWMFTNFMGIKAIGDHLVFGLYDRSLDTREMKLITMNIDNGKKIDEISTTTLDNTRPSFTIVDDILLLRTGKSKIEAIEIE